MNPIRIRETETGIRLGHYEPGNGTSYRAIAVPWNDNEYQQGLGKISTPGWLVVSCMAERRAYLIGQDVDGYLVDDYIQEKLGGLPGDYPYFGDLIRVLIER